MIIQESIKYCKFKEENKIWKTLWAFSKTGYVVNECT